MMARLMVAQQMCVIVDGAGAASSPFAAANLQSRRRTAFRGRRPHESGLIRRAPEEIIRTINGLLAGGDEPSLMILLVCASLSDGSSTVTRAAAAC